MFLLGVSGTLNSGYHLTDDHEIVRIKYDLASQNTLTVAVNWMKRDQFSTHRFRPFYFFHRVIETKVFGANFFAWSIYTAILAIITSFLLFYFLSLLGFSFWESLLFSLVALIGPQADIWWRLGPNETIGMFMLAVSLFFLVKYYTSEKNTKAIKILFVIFAILATLSKESFLLLLPAIMLLLAYLMKRKENIFWQDSIRRNCISLGVLAGVFAGCILYIKFFIGIGGVGYAGMVGFAPMKYAKTFLNLSIKSWVGYFIFFQIISLVILMMLKKESKNIIIESSKKLFLLSIIFLAVVIPQVVLYTKSGFNKRYLLPVMLVYAFVFIFLLREIRRRSKLILVGMIIVALFFIKGDIKKGFKTASNFSQEGVAINNVFRTVKANTSKDENFLIVGDPAMYYEWADSINYYLRYELDRKNLFIYALPRKKSYSNFNKKLIKGFGSIYGDSRYENINNKSIFDAIILFPRMEKSFLKKFPKNDILKDKFKRQKFDDFVIYYKTKE